MDSCIENELPAHDPAKESEVRSALFGLLGLLAAEVARRLPAADEPGRRRPPRDRDTTGEGGPVEQDRPEAADTGARS
jgi:hypothetical protein